MSNVGPCKKGLIILNNISLSITSWENTDPICLGHNG
jgi:hypothetical protein